MSPACDADPVVEAAAGDGAARHGVDRRPLEDGGREVRMAVDEGAGVDARAAGDVEQGAAPGEVERRAAAAGPR